MSRISRVGCVCSGLGENKAQGSPAPLPLPPRFLLARDGDRWLPEGRERQGRSWLVAACLWESWKFLCASVSLIRGVLGAAGWSPGVGLLRVALEGQAVLGLLCSGDASEVLAWRSEPAGEGAGSHST